MLLWGLYIEIGNKDIRCACAHIYVSHTSTECYKLQVATCRDEHTKHSSDCDSVVTEFLKIGKKYRPPGICDCVSAVIVLGTTNSLCQSI